MFCQKCGAEVADGAVSCSDCGMPAVQGTTLPPPNEYAPAPTAMYAPGEVPEEIKGFNFGAFALNWTWAFAHRLWVWGILFFVFVFIPHVTIVAWLGIAIYLGIKGNELAWKARPFESVQQFKKTQRVWTIAGTVLFPIQILIIPFLIIAITNFTRTSHKSNFAYTVQALKNIASGMEQEISEKGNLANVNDEDDICHHVLSGHATAATCKGQVKASFDEIGVKGTLDVTTDNNMLYEIKGQSNDKFQCRICVTEKAIRPQTYDPRGACSVYDCVH